MLPDEVRGVGLVTGWTYQFAVFLHLMAAIIWLGGMFFFALVGAPVLRTIEPHELRMRLFRDLGVRFRSVGWGALALLGITGIWILHLRGVLRSDAILDAGWWSTPFGRALTWKLGAVLIMVVVSGLHDFVFGPRASRDTGDATDRVRQRRLALHLARINALVGLVLVYWAMRLARGG